MAYRNKTAKNKQTIIKVIAIALAALLLAAVGVFAYRHFYAKSNNTAQTDQPNQQKINYDPPTQQDIQAADQHKEDLSKNGSTDTSTPTNSQKTVNITIVDASQYDQQIEVRAFVSGVVENGGTCTYVFTSGSSKITKQTKAAADATTTRCPTLDTPRSEFTAGNWSVTVSYASSTASGSSQAKSFEVR